MRITLIAALLAVAAAWSPCHAAADVMFRVRDRMASDEVAELTTLYVDGQMIRSFRLDADNRDDTVTVTVPDAGPHEYGLCGHIVIHDPDGTLRQQAIDVTGTIEDVADRDFEAIASEDFTRFYLLETTQGREPTKLTLRKAHACAPAVS